MWWEITHYGGMNIGRMFRGSVYMIGYTDIIYPECCPPILPNFLNVVLWLTESWGVGWLLT
jgi:hypothetical protein